MAEIKDKGFYAWREFDTDGVPTSGEHEPVKAEIKEFVAQVDAAFASMTEGLLVGNAVVYGTRAALYADLAHPAGRLGVVYNDGTAVYNGVYIKSGASDAGSWTLTNLGLPSTSAAELATKANDNAVVKLTGNQTIDGTKTFSTAPAVPDGAFAPSKVSGLPAALSSTTAAINALSAADAGFVSNARERPGEVQNLFSTTLTGSAASRPPLSIGTVVASDALGAAVQVSGSEIITAFPGQGYVDIAPRLDLAIETGHKYRLTWSFERAVNPADPLNEAVELRIQNLNKNKASVSNVRVGETSGDGVLVLNGDAYALTVANGPLERSIVIAREAADDVQYVVPLTTRYITPEIRIYGSTGATNVAKIELDDISQAQTIIGDIGGVQAQIDALDVAKADLAALNAHAGAVNNPHVVTKAQVGLGNADNTSDLDKPISTAVQTALNSVVTLTDFATDAETIAGTLTNKVTSPANVKAVTKQYHQTVDLGSDAPAALFVAGKDRQKVAFGHLEKDGTVRIYKTNRNRIADIQGADWIETLGTNRFAVISRAVIDGKFYGGGSGESLVIPPSDDEVPLEWMPTDFERGYNDEWSWWNITAIQYGKNFYDCTVGMPQEPALTGGGYVFLTQMLHGATAMKVILAFEVKRDDHNAGSPLIDPRPGAPYPLMVFQGGHVSGGVRIWRSATMDARDLKEVGYITPSAGLSYAQPFHHPDNPGEIWVFGRYDNKVGYHWSIRRTLDYGDTWTIVPITRTQNMYINPVFRLNGKGFELFCHINPNGGVADSKRRLKRLRLDWNGDISSHVGGALGNVFAPGFVPITPWTSETIADTIGTLSGFTVPAGYKLRMVSAQQTDQFEDSAVYEIAMARWLYTDPGESNFSDANARLRHFEVTIPDSGALTIVEADLTELGYPIGAGMNGEVTFGAGSEGSDEDGSGPSPTYIGGAVIIGRNTVLTTANNPPSKPGRGVVEVHQKKAGVWSKFEVESPPRQVGRPAVFQEVYLDGIKWRTRLGTAVKWRAGNTGQVSDWAGFETYNIGVRRSLIAELIGVPPLPPASAASLAVVPKSGGGATVTAYPPGGDPYVFRGAVYRKPAGATLDRVTHKIFEMRLAQKWRFDDTVSTGTYDYVCETFNALGRAGPLFTLPNVIIL